MKCNNVSRIFEHLDDVRVVIWLHVLLFSPVACTAKRSARTCLSSQVEAIWACMHIWHQLGGWPLTSAPFDQAASRPQMKRESRLESAHKKI